MFKKIYPLFVVIFVACQTNKPIDGNQYQFQATEPTHMATTTLTLVEAQQAVPTQTSTLIPSKDIDGRELSLVFTSNRQLWYWKQEIAIPLTRISKNAIVKLSNDGSMVLYADFSVDQPDIFSLSVYFISQSSSRLLVDSDSLLDLVSMGLESPNAYFEWIPGTHNVLLSDPVTGRAYIIDVDTSDVKKIESVSDSGFIHISPDGKSLLLISPTKIFTIDLNSGMKRKLFDYEAVAFEGEGQFSISPTWNTDATSFVIVVPVSSVNTSYSLYQVWEINTNGHAELLTEVSANLYSYSVSPDRNFVVYLQRVNPDFDYPNELHIRNLKSGNDIVVADGNLDFIAWSPDAKRFAYSEIKNGATDYYLGHTHQAGVVQHVVSFLSWIDNDSFFLPTFQINFVDSDEVINIVDDSVKIDSFDFIVTP